jgi:hypothetical protein
VEEEVEAEREADSTEVAQEQEQEQEKLSVGSGVDDGGVVDIEQRSTAIHRPVKAGMEVAVARAIGELNLQAAATSAAPNAATDTNAGASPSDAIASSSGGDGVGTADAHTSSGGGLGGHGLRSLVLCGNPQFRDDGVVALLQGSATKTSLQQLDISGCSKLSNLALQLPPTVSGAVGGGRPAEVVPARP